MEDLSITIGLQVLDGEFKRGIGQVRIYRGEPHRNIRFAYWYHYEAEVQNDDGTSGTYEGALVHSPRKHSAIRLISKVFRSIRKDMEAKNGD